MPRHQHRADEDNIASVQVAAVKRNWQALSLQVHQATTSLNRRVLRLAAATEH